MELQDAIETRLMLSVGKIIMKAANRREESRGAHFRVDCPEQKKEWNANLILTKKGDDVSCDRKIK
jgi:succinate dehydrogenase/fumarate reductase flavoprotein subunit